MAKTKDQKKEIIKYYEDMTSDATGIIFTDNPGLKVNDVNELRKRLSTSDSKFHILKNKLFGLIAKEKWGEVDEVLAGPTAAIISTGDITAAAKTLKDYFKDVEDVEVEVKGGVLQNLFINANKAKSLADLPSKEELIAKTVYMFNAPLSGFANVLSGNTRNLVNVLQAVKEAKA